VTGDLVRRGDPPRLTQKPEIEFWQGGLRLAAFGVREAAWSLPQDEVTAAVVLGALLARNLADERWPGEYRAMVPTGAGPVEVAEDDPRVAQARAMLRGLFEDKYGKVLCREFRAGELEWARGVLLAVGAQPDSAGPKVSDVGGV
jgi:hypothetical protein